MFVKEKCKDCAGSGIVYMQMSSFFGIVKKQIPMSCSTCGGKGYILKEPPCKFCNGEGLVGNEREVCRVCNGTGYSDEFRWIPRRKLTKGTTFQRVCSICKRKTIHEILTEIETVKVVPRWSEGNAEKAFLRERVKVGCRECHDSYYVDIDPDFHKEETEEIREYLLTRELASHPPTQPYQPSTFG